MINIKFDDNDPRLCVNCAHLNNEIVEGHLKCYWRCPYRKIKGMDKWI